VGDYLDSNVTPDDQSVFLNLPFDKGYEKLFIALIATLVSIGRIPHSVLEISECGQGRLRRILTQMEACRVSLHDLSRVGNPPRFNMPFELGLAYALRAYRSGPKRYLFVVLEREQHRLSRTLSDLAGHDPAIHHGKPRGMISAVLDSLGPPRSPPAPQDVYRLWKKLMRVSRVLKREHQQETVFSRSLFNQLVASATELAVEAGLLHP
jgi:hypothetical protein